MSGPETGGRSGALALGFLSHMENLYIRIYVDVMLTGSQLEYATNTKGFFRRYSGPLYLPFLLFYFVNVFCFIVTAALRFSLTTRSFGAVVGFFAVSAVPLGVLIWSFVDLLKIARHYKYERKQMEQSPGADRQEPRH